jgi:hypothetical protein
MEAVLQTFIYFMLPKRGYALLRVKFHALFCFAGFFIILESRKNLKFKMGIDVRDFHVFLSEQITHEHRDCTIYKEGNKSELTVI